jgi:ketosteroid isomerase-like protein
MRLNLLATAALVISASLRAQPSDTTSTKAALLTADYALRASALTSGAGVVLDALGERAVIEFAGAPMFANARDARAAFTARYGTPNRYDWQPQYAIAGTDGRFGCVVGSSTLTVADSVRRGTYITCWQRDARGAWRIAGQQRSDGAAVAAALPVPTAPPIGVVPHSAERSGGSAALGAAQNADSTFALMGSEAAGPGPAFHRFAADDAIFPGPTPTRGRAAIAKSFDGYPAERVLTWAPRREFGAAGGGLAFTVGDAATKKRKSGAELGRSHYFTVWRLEGDGSWKWILDLGSQRP